MRDLELDITFDHSIELINKVTLDFVKEQVDVNRKELTEIEYLNFIIIHTENLIYENSKHGNINIVRFYTHHLRHYKDYLSIISDTEDKEFVTVEKYLKLHPTIKKNNIYFWIRIKKLKAYKFNKKHTLIRLSEIQKLKK